MVDQSVNGGRKVGHVGGLIVGLRQRSGTFCRRRQRGSTGAQYAGSSGLINIKMDDALLHLLTGHYPALSRLMDDVVSEGREFNAVLVWNHSRLSRNVAEFAELRRTLREHGVDLVSISDSSRLSASERQLAESSGDEESAC